MNPSGQSNTRGLCFTFNLGVGGYLGHGLGAFADTGLGRAELFGDFCHRRQHAFAANRLNAAACGQSDGLYLSGAQLGDFVANRLGSGGTAADGCGGGWPDHPCVGVAA